MASTGENPEPFSPCGILSKLGLVPGGNGGTCSKAITVIGGTSYVALAVNMFNPDLVNSISPKRDLTNVILTGTLVGGSLYLIQRPHLAALEDPKKKILFSVYGATMAGFGSLLLWAMVRALLPDNSTLRTIAAIGSGIALMRTGTAYINLIDGLASSSK